jgi:hypothetical protein
MNNNLTDSKQRFTAHLDSLDAGDKKKFAEYVSAYLEQDSTSKTAETSSVSIQEVLARFYVLGTLMVFQSLSSFILSSYQGFIENNIYITLYLTMLVGAGGNAGNQSTVMGKCVYCLLFPSLIHHAQ